MRAQKLNENRVGIKKPILICTYILMEFLFTGGLAFGVARSPNLATSTQWPFYLNLSVTQAEDVQSSWPLRTETLEALDSIDNPEAETLNWKTRQRPYPTKLQFDVLDLDKYFYLRRLKQIKIQKTSTFQSQIKDLDSSSSFSTIDLFSDEERPTVVFLDINFAPAEIKEAQKTASLMGENFLVFPQRSKDQQIQIEKLYRQKLDLDHRNQSCLHQPQPGCENIDQKMKQTQSELSRVLESIEKISHFQSIAEQLEKKHVRLSRLIVSGHSGGGGGFSGVFGHISPEDIVSSLNHTPAISETLSSIYLWGCYTGTLASLSQSWQQKLQKHVALFGYRNRAPLGIRPESGNLLSDLILHDKELTHLPSTAKKHEAFKKIKNVGRFDVTALIQNIYLAYDRSATVDDLLQICQTLDPKLVSTFQCYFRGDKGCENPPSNHLGPLRELYTFLQVNRHCDETMRSQYPALPSPDKLVLLIYLDNVKYNFDHFYRNTFDGFEDLLKKNNLPTPLGPKEYIHSSRQKDIQRVNETLMALGTHGNNDGSFVFLENWRDFYKLQLSFFALQNFFMPFEYMLQWAMPPCTPFSWVERGSKEIDQCGYGLYTREPLSKTQLAKLVDEFYQARFQIESESYVPRVFELLFRLQLIEGEKASSIYTEMLEEELKNLESYTNKSQRQKLLISEYQNQIEQIEACSTESEKTRWIVQQAEKVLPVISRLQLKAQSEPDGPFTLQALPRWERQIKEILKALNE